MIPIYSKEANVQMQVSTRLLLNFELGEELGRATWRLGGISLLGITEKKMEATIVYIGVIQGSFWDRGKKEATIVEWAILGVYMG